MLLDEYYNRVNLLTSMPKEKRIVFKILQDILNRHRLRHEFEGIDSDIQEEILETWIKIAKEVIEEQCQSVPPTPAPTKGQSNPTESSPILKVVGVTVNVFHVER